MPLKSTKLSPGSIPYFCKARWLDVTSDLSSFFTATRVSVLQQRETERYIQLLERERERGGGGGGGERGRPAHGGEALGEVSEDTESHVRRRVGHTLSCLEPKVWDNIQLTIYSIDMP